MLSIEDLARIHREEMIQKALQEQRHQRMLSPRRKNASFAVMVRFWLGLFMGH